MQSSAKGKQVNNHHQVDSLKKQGSGSYTTCPTVNVTSNPLAFPPTGEYQLVWAEEMLSKLSGFHTFVLRILTAN